MAPVEGCHCGETEIAAAEPSLKIQCRAILWLAPLILSPRRRHEIRVFISSTFRDMQEEREELVKQIFPQLRRLCESRGVTWAEVDLR
jgi:hypothetical protein